MTPEERKELDLVHVAIKHINTAIGKINESVADHEENLRAKSEHLGTVTDFANAGRVLLMSLQRVIADDPVRCAALALAISQIHQRIEDRLLFSTVSDEAMARSAAVLDKLLLPEVRKHVQPKPLG